MGSAAFKRLSFIHAVPLTAHLELTYRCTWRCGFCSSPRRHDLDPLPIERWLGVLDGLRELGTMTVIFTGGEPLAHPRWLELARAARSRELAIRVFTNGSLVDDSAADSLAELLPLSVELSLHGGCAATHDGTTGVAGSFEDLLAAVKRLQTRGVAVALKTPITRWNVTEIDDVIALAESLSAPLRLDPEIHPRDDGDPAPLAWAAGCDQVRRLLAGPVAIGALPEVERRPDEAVCGVGRVTVAVDPEGTVWPCVMWRHEALGSVRETPIAELWRTSPVRREAADAAVRANRRLLELGGPVARLPFCPADAARRTGDPCAITPGHLALAETAAAPRSAG